MDHDELAALLAQTHDGGAKAASHSTHPSKSFKSSSSHWQPFPPHPPPSLFPSSPTRIRLHDPDAASPPLVPLSPRQIFQSRVRTLSDDGTDGTPTSTTNLSPTSSPTRKTPELQHLSSLRVRVRSTTPTSPILARRNRHSQGYSSRHVRYSFTPTDPEFMVEERAAWCAESQSQSRPLDHSPAVVPLSNVDEEDPEATKLGPIPSAAHPPLMHFGPLSASTQDYDRPKTSRGLNHDTSIDHIPGAFPDTNTETNSQRHAQAARRSKFNEGSMNDRSTAIASTWDDYGPRLSQSSGDASAYDDSDLDSDATRRASRLSRDTKTSFDLDEFHPRPPTPSTLKQTISRLGSHFRSASTANADHSEKAVVEQKKDKRQSNRLRKSISNWNFHSLADKIKFFGNSTHDLQDDPNKDQDEPDIFLLNDRKRKAEEAYAHQFGTKKQKSNQGFPVPENVSSTPAQPRILKKRSTSAHRTITTNNIRRRRETSPLGQPLPADPAEIMSSGDIDRLKRPTRRELEKENQQLRAMLRENQQQRSASMVRSASKSTVHLPLEIKNTLSIPRLGSTTTAFQHTNAGSSVIPPVPALPSRAVLANLGTGNIPNGRTGGAASLAQFSQQLSHFGAAETGTIRRLGGGLPGPVCISSEDEENIPAVGNNVSNVDMLPGQESSPSKNDWKWPDDVF